MALSNNQRVQNVMDFVDLVNVNPAETFFWLMNQGVSPKQKLPNICCHFMALPIFFSSA